MKNLGKTPKKSFRADKVSLATASSTILNFLTALAKIAAGVVGASVFTVISGFYSIGMGCAKRVYAKGVKIDDAMSRLNCLAVMAAILIAASLLYIAYSVRQLFAPTSFGFGMIVAIAIAAIAFFDLGVAVRGLIKSKKHGDFLLSGLKKINFSSALAAIALTQFALLSVVADSPKSAALANAVMGFVVGAVSAILGAAMLFDYFKRKSYMK